MSDKELLELAAKAAGLINARYHEATGEDYDCGTCILHDTENGRSTHAWKPLTDDGDALRLAVKLGLSVRTSRYGVQRGTIVGWFKSSSIGEPHLSDPYAATRKAITRAAAEIGKAMPDGGGTQ